MKYNKNSSCFCFEKCNLYFNFNFQKDPDQEDELTELQLRLEALRSTIEKSNEKCLEIENISNQKQKSVGAEETINRNSFPDDSARKSYSKPNTGQQKRRRCKRLNSVSKFYFIYLQKNKNKQKQSKIK